ncbi:fumarylacetoacetate hydrolase family protein [Novipirellula artificiosorum]|uniref:Ureidoglycolate lyase n=1 Tax=Novipirellula artificiosorum TaxID=2528016 RepID=A0A5C6DNH3_9BACT|nr:fumarylacetoacetate hydrolase family protein [Novipirellula artificiosorum]TWU37211.1 Ureidoglycolate lyase [Novipirellula artificiosorum]
MAICRFTNARGQAEYAFYRDHQLCPLSSFAHDAPNEWSLLAGNSDWLAKLPQPTDSQWQPAPQRLLPPVAHGGKVICIGLNYRDHAIETGADIPTEPVVFSKFDTALIGHGEPIRLPRIAHQVDYEAELVVVIGKTAKQVSIDTAMDHVLGYTCGHDVSARDWQNGRPGGQWLLGKTFDTFAPLGPCIVTTDELPDPSNLRVRMHLNGEVVQDSTTKQLIFSVPELITHLSQIVTLKPGDIIFTGTPPGVGAARKPPVFLAPGDTCSVEVEGIGTLTNPCVAEGSEYSDSA